MVIELSVFPLCCPDVHTVRIYTPPDDVKDNDPLFLRGFECVFIKWPHDDEAAPFLAHAPGPIQVGCPTGQARDGNTSFSSHPAHGQKGGQEPLSVSTVEAAEQRSVVFVGPDRHVRAQAGRMMEYGFLASSGVGGLLLWSIA
jgi:hypothetical protein